MRINYFIILLTILSLFILLLPSNLDFPDIISAIRLFLSIKGIAPYTDIYYTVSDKIFKEVLSLVPHIIGPHLLNDSAQ